MTSPHAMPEEGTRALLARALEGDTTAFWQLAERHQRMIYATAFGILRDHDMASDVVHDVYIRAFSTLGNLRSPDALGAWLHKMARNMSYEKLRKAGRLEREAERALPPLVISVPDLLIREEELRLLEQALNELPENHRIVLGFKYMDHMSCRQIAETLDIGIEAAKSRLFEARRALRARMMAAEEPPAIPPAEHHRGGHTHGSRTHEAES